MDRLLQKSYRWAVIVSFFGLAACSTGQSSSPNVNNVNEAPTISGTPATSVLEGETYTFTPVGTDVNTGDTLTFSLSQDGSLPAWLSFNPDTGVLTGMPGNADVGTINNIVISVTDGKQTVSLPAFNLEVVNVNEPPTIAGTPPDFALVNESFVFSPTVADVDANDPLSNLTYSATLADGSPLPSWLSLDTSSLPQLILSGTPQVSDVTTGMNIALKADDGHGEGPTTFTFSIDVVNATIVNLIWDNPTTFTDGSALDPATDLTGYQVCYTREGGTENCDLVDTDPGGNTYTTQPLALGTYTFRVTVFAGASNESGNSNLLNAVF
jgi:hypothetical protein